MSAYSIGARAFIESGIEADYCVVTESGWKNPCLGAFGKMIALAFTRWQFARRCREQYDELSRLLREPAVLG